MITWSWAVPYVLLRGAGEARRWHLLALFLAATIPSNMLHNFMLSLTSLVFLPHARAVASNARAFAAGLRSPEEERRLRRAACDGPCEVDRPSSARVVEASTKYLSTALPRRASWKRRRNICRPPFLDARRGSVVESI